MYSGAPELELPGEHGATYVARLSMDLLKLLELDRGGAVLLHDDDSIAMTVDERRHALRYGRIHL
jgi:hypothetical protein